MILFLVLWPFFSLGTLLFIEQVCEWTGIKLTEPTIVLSSVFFPVWWLFFFALVIRSLFTRYK
jgi:hypothetical protein